MPSPEERDQKAPSTQYTASELAEQNRIDEERLNTLAQGLVNAEKRAQEMLGNSLPVHPLKEILDDCLSQVTNGKGDERHGQGKGFLDQPWKSLADVHGVGFLTGQAAKKLEEAQGFDREDIDKWDREMYGVIVYAAMAILYRRKYEED